MLIVLEVNIVKCLKKELENASEENKESISKKIEEQQQKQNEIKNLIHECQNSIKSSEIELLQSQLSTQSDSPAEDALERLRANTEVLDRISKNSDTFVRSKIKTDANDVNPETQDKKTQKTKRTL